LKPVVCRRVVGRLPPLPRREMVVYLVRSLGFEPESSSHDWHVQPSCQRTEPLPPERALSVQYRNTHKCISACPRNLYKLRVLRGHCQPIAITGFPPVFHIRGVPKILSFVIPKRLQP